MRQKTMGRRLAVLLVLLSAVAIIAVQPATGGGAGAVIVRGDQLADTSGNPWDCLAGGPYEFPVYAMAGDLVGCWYTDTFEVRQANDNPGGSFKASGTEHFVGCLNTNGNMTCDQGEPYGRFATTFTFTAKLAPTGDEIHGRCQHPIVGGIDGFAGASGVISFKDIPSEGRFPYHGNIKT